MKFQIIIISKTHIIHHNISQVFPHFGYEITSFHDFIAPVQKLNTLDGDILLLDADGDQKYWNLFLQGFKKTEKKIPFMLLKGNISAENAQNFVTLGSSGILLKPFKPAEHIQKILEVICKSQNITLKRRAPRFYIKPDELGKISYFSTSKHENREVPLINITERGAAILVEDQEVLYELRPGISVPLGVISINDFKAEASFRVIGQNGNQTGLFFENISKGKSEFMKYLHSLTDKIFGSKEVSGKW